MPTRLTARAILFDMDGTLVDSTAVVEQVWGRFARANGVDIVELLSTSHGVRAVDTIRLHAPSLDAEVAADELAAYELTQNEGIVEIPGAAAFAGRVPDGGFAVVTSAPRQLAALRLALCGIRVPTVLVGAEDIEHGKPSPDPYLMAAAELGVDPDDCVVFEDAPAGIQAGLAAGMRVVVVGDVEADITSGLPRIPDYSASTIEPHDGSFTIVVG